GELGPGGDVLQPDPLVSGQPVLLDGGVLLIQHVCVLVVGGVRSAVDLEVGVAGGGLVEDAVTVGAANPSVGDQEGEPRGVLGPGHATRGGFLVRLLLGGSVRGLC